MTINYKASPIGAKVSEDKRSLWGSSKLVVEVVHVSHLVNHLLVCKAGRQWLGINGRESIMWRSYLDIRTTREILMYQTCSIGA